MELSPEDKQRIEEEERRRISEEQYRAEVRSKLRGETPTAPVQRSNTPWLLGIALVLVIVALVAWSITNSSNVKLKTSDVAATAPKPSPLPPVPKTRYVPVNQKIATGQILVKARGFVQYQITITAEMVQPVLTGNFDASGGHGSDILAAIIDDDNYINWINGHQARVYWNTQGRETTGRFEVRLPPGTYHLAFSNKFSLLTDKEIFVNADLNYKKAETYYDDQAGQPVNCPVPPCTQVVPYHANMPDIH
jgi:hypothetical protein